MFNPPDWMLQWLMWFFGAGGPIVGAYYWYQMRKKRPIDTSTAQVANAIAISNVAKGIVDMLNGQIDDFKTHIETQDGKIEKQNVEIASLKDLVINIENIWGVWYADLSNRWSFHRLQDKAPNAPDGRYNE